MNPFLVAGARRTVVVGHPGHELAMFGWLQRHTPDAIVVITDGGSETRVNESRRGLDSIGLTSRVSYLDYPEHAFYEALLNADVAFMTHVVASVRCALEAAAPTQVFCDAVEFYNPVHDITLPLVRAALAGSATPVFETPLVYELEGEPDVYRVQRVPESLAHTRVVFDLSPDELEAKAAARDGIYRSLHKQAGPELLGVSRMDLAREEIALAPERTPAPRTHGRALRYERRGRLLHAEGRIARVITYDDHFAPMLDALGVARDVR